MVVPWATSVTCKSSIVFNDSIEKGRFLFNSHQKTIGYSVRCALEASTASPYDNALVKKKIDLLLPLTYWFFVSSGSYPPFPLNFIWLPMLCFCDNRLKYNIISMLERQIKHHADANYGLQFVVLILFLGKYFWNIVTSTESIKLIDISINMMSQCLDWARDPRVINTYIGRSNSKCTSILEHKLFYFYLFHFFIILIIIMFIFLIHLKYI